MNDNELKSLIDRAVTATVLKLKTEGLLIKPISSVEKTEELLRQYPVLQGVDEPYAERVAREVETCLEESRNEPYADVIRLFYFDGLKNAACAKRLNCDERTARRARKQLVKQFSARLASEDFIRELLL